jgi:fucose permease
MEENMQNWRIKLSLFLNFFVFAILLNSVGIVILQVINTYNVAKVPASILEACKDLSIAVTSFLVASYLPRLGYKKSMLISLAIMTLCLIAMPLVGGFMMTKILFICTGITFALIKVSVYSTVGLLTENPQQHASFMSILEGIFQTGVLVGYWLFGFFISSGVFTWLDTYWALAGMTALAFLLLLTTRLDESAIHVHTQGSSITGDFVNMLRLVKFPLVLIFVFSIFLYVFIEQGIQSWLPTFNNKILQLPESISVQITSILAGSIAVGRITGGYVMKRLSWPYVLMTSLACSVVLIVLTLPLTQGIAQGSVTGWGSVPIAAFIFPVIGFFLAPIYPTLCSSVLSKLPKANQSAMVGLIVIFSALGGTIGSRIVSIVFQSLGGQIAFYSTIIPIVILFLIIIPYRKLHNRFELKEGELGAHALGVNRPSTSPAPERS